jgi:thiol-disulfide isomerase/thioredoxin
MSPKFFSDKFAAALPYDAYVQTGTDDQRNRWKQVYDLARLTDGQQTLLKGFVRQMNLLLISGIWCGDCVQQCPLIARIAEANPEKISLRILDRDQHRDLAEPFRMNGGDRIPVLISLAEDFEFCGVFGERTISRYRIFAHRYLGPACPTGIIAPDTEEIAATLADWLTEIERIQLMLRLSPRLRQKHGD